MEAGDWRYTENRTQMKRNQDPHDRNFPAQINKKNFLGGATEQNTR